MSNAASEASIAVPHGAPVARPAAAAAAGTALAAAGLCISVWVGQAKPVDGSTLLLAAASVAAALVEIEYAPKFLISGGFTFFMLDAAYAGAEATAAIVALAMTVTALTYGARRAAWAVNLGATVLRRRFAGSGPLHLTRVYKNSGSRPRRDGRRSEAMRRRLLGLTASPHRRAYVATSRRRRCDGRSGGSYTDPRNVTATGR
jgi:hypothetical protein